MVPDTLFGIPEEKFSGVEILLSDPGILDIELESCNVVDMKGP